MEKKNRRLFASASWRPQMYAAEGSVEFTLLDDGRLPRLRIRWHEKDDEGVVRRRETVFGNFRRYGWGTGHGWDMSGFSGHCYANGGDLGVEGIMPLTPREVVAGHFVRAVARLDIPQDVVAEEECQKHLAFLLEDALRAVETNPQARRFAELGARSWGMYTDKTRALASYRITSPEAERAAG